MAYCKKCNTRWRGANVFYCPTCGDRIGGSGCFAALIFASMFVFVYFMMNDTVKKEDVLPENEGNGRGNFAMLVDGDNLSQHLLGSWELTTIQNGTHVRSTGTFFEDGRYVMERTVTARGQTNHFSLATTWKVEGKRIQHQVTRSNIPGAASVGESHFVDVVRLTDKELDVRDSDGDHYTWRRVGG